MLSNRELAQIDRKTWSGHNHTEFCPHGSGEACEQFIQQAIAAGFKTYSITEHFPVPEALTAKPLGSRHAQVTAAMAPADLPVYLDQMTQLKAKYRDQIRILVGFEVDFLAPYAEWTARQLAIYADQIDDAILSVHFLPTSEGFRAVDDSVLDFRTGVLRAYGSPLAVANAYLQQVLAAVTWQAANKPHRYGHIMLYRKWRNAFPPQTIWGDDTTRRLLMEIITTIRAQQDLLDCNMAGLFRPLETESTPTAPWLQAAQAQGIPLVFGADAHQVSAVAQGYNTYLENIYYH